MHYHQHFVSLILILIQITKQYSKIIEDRQITCSSDKMVVSLTFKNPFNGLVFVQNHYDHDECRWKGNGSHNLLILIPINTSSNFNKSNDFCGIHSSSNIREHSITLIITPDAVILTEEAFSLTIRCMETDFLLGLEAPSLDAASFRILQAESMTIQKNSGSIPLLGLRILNGHGMAGENVSYASVGQRLTLDVYLKETSIYDMFVHDCIAHDGKHDPESTITIINSNGCAVRLPRAIDSPVFSNVAYKNAAKHVYVHIYGFQFTGSNLVTFECQITPCVYLCHNKQCDENDSKIDIKSMSQELTKTSVQFILKMNPQERQYKVIPQALREDTESNCLNVAGAIVLIVFAFVAGSSLMIYSMLKLFFISKKRFNNF